MAFEGPLGLVERMRDDKPNCSSLLKGCRQRMRTLAQLPSAALCESFSASSKDIPATHLTMAVQSEHSNTVLCCNRQKLLHSVANYPRNGAFPTLLLL